MKFEPRIVTFSGPIASGKSTIADALSSLTGWHIASFGNKARDEAAKRGLDHTDRSVLQQIGLELISKGWDVFCEAVLEQANWEPGQGLIIDGIRHMEALQQLEILVRPAELLLVYVETPKGVRLARFQNRDREGLSLDEAEKANTESQVEGILKASADILVDGTAVPAENARKIIRFVRGNRAGGT